MPHYSYVTSTVRTSKRLFSSSGYKPPSLVNHSQVTEVPLRGHGDMQTSNAICGQASWLQFQRIEVPLHGTGKIGCS